MRDAPFNAIIKIFYRKIYLFSRVLTKEKRREKREKSKNEEAGLS
jgi:hypothetical protein